MTWRIRGKDGECWTVVSHESDERNSIKPHCSRIELLGRFRACLDGMPPVELPRQHAGAVLACLALRPHRSHSREELVGLFWPDDDFEDGRAKLRKALHAIRGRLADLGIQPESVLQSNRETVQLDPATISTDVRDFEESLSRAAECESLSDRARFLARAVSLYAGDLLPGFYQDCFIAEQTRLAQAYRSALHELTLAYEQLGSFDHALEVARTAVALDPINEDAHCDLMRLYAANGQPAALLRQYQELERVLESELGEKPSDTSLRLLHSLRESGSARVIDRPPGQAVRPSVMHPGEVYSPLLPSLSRPRAGRVWIAFAACAVAFSLLGLSGLPRSADAPPSNSSAAPIASAFGQELWVARYSAQPDERDSEPTAMVADPEGNLYICGFVQTTGNDVDFLTLKYDPNGKLLWRRRYNGPGNDVDRARSIALGTDRSVYVTGDSDNGKGNGSTRLSGLDYATVKYDRNGERLWVARFNGPDNGEDMPRKLLVDDAGGVLVYGSSRSLRGAGDYALIKYFPNGKEEWAVRYDGQAHRDELPSDIVRDSRGDIYVTGASGSLPNSGPEFDYLTIKYSVAGLRLWVRFHGQRNQADDRARHLGFDWDENVYVIGEGRGAPGTLDAEKIGSITVKYSPTGSLLRARGTTREADRITRIQSALVFHDGGAVIMGGAFERSGVGKIRVVARDGGGLSEWSSDGGSMAWWDEGPVSVDYDGCVYLTVSMSGHLSGSTGHDYGLLKYDSSGRLVSKRFYDGDKNRDVARATAVLRGPHPGLAVTGQSRTRKGNNDMLTVKYNP